jgi:UDP-N-acetylmuramoylalanine--D-glutamate ligase
VVGERQTVGRGRREAFRGKRVSVLGAARSGIAVARLVSSEGASVFVSDQSGDLLSARQALDLAGIPYELGGHTDRVLDAELVVMSPGVPSDAPIVRRARQRGIALASELEVASWFWDGDILAVTGTNGKTTTTALLGRMLADGGIEAVVGGNIGTAFSELAMGGNRSAVAVLEVSSFQLDHCETLRPRVALLLNITPDHLDRYGQAFDRYVESKSRILRQQGTGDSVVYCADDATVRGVVERHAGASVLRLAFTRGDVVEAGAFLQNGVLMHRLEGSAQRIIDAGEISIPGVHNLYNAMAASLAARMVGVSPARIRATLRNFKGVEHRLEFVRELDGVRYINDSKATNVDAVHYALESFQGPIILLLGGRDKGNDYSVLAEAVRTRVRAIIAIGESAATVQEAFARIVPVETATSMEEAVHLSAERARAGDVILLSPACASFDWFRNYEHRGEVFKALVRSLTAAS